MKILYISNGYKPYRWAGTENYTAGIAEEIASRGHAVEVICAGDWDQGSQYWNGVTEDVQNSIRVRRVNLNWAKSPAPFRYLYHNPVTAGYLQEILQREKFDLVHVTSCETLSASILQVTKDAGLPLVFSITDFWMLCPRINLLHADGSNCTGQTTPDECLSCMLRKSRWYRKSRKIAPEKALLIPLRSISKIPFLARCRGLNGLAGDMTERKAMLHHALTLPDYLVTASPFVRDIFVANGVSTPLDVQPYGHELDWLHGYTGKSRSDRLRLGFIGQINKSKGVHVILKAFSHLPKDCLDRLSLIIYGNLDHNPPYSQKIRELASSFSNVTFAGTYQRAESAHVFSNIDVLLVPSLWFDFPLVIHEAFATQTPVITTNLGGMAEVVTENENGLLVKRGDAADLARQIKRLLDEPSLLSQLRSGLPCVRTVKDEVDVLEKKYFELIV